MAVVVYYSGEKIEERENEKEIGNEGGGHS